MTALPKLAPNFASALALASALLFPATTFADIVTETAFSYGTAMRFAMINPNVSHVLSTGSIGTRFDPGIFCALKFSLAEFGDAAEVGPSTLDLHIKHSEVSFIGSSAFPLDLIVTAAASTADSVAAADFYLPRETVFTTGLAANAYDYGNSVYAVRPLQIDVSDIIRSLVAAGATAVEFFFEVRDCSKRGVGRRFVVWNASPTPAT